MSTAYEFKYQSAVVLPRYPSTVRRGRTKIASCIPLLRFAAHVRARTSVEADALVEATLQEAVARIEEYSVDISAQAWLLGIQRAIYRMGQGDGGGAAVLSSKQAGDGHEDCDDNLHAALLQLPDDLREPLVLLESAQCTIAEVADILACDVATAERRVEEARCKLMELCEFKSEFSQRDSVALCGEA